MIRSVLFVCMGNLCRSPMAQAMASRAMPWLAIDSAGLCAPPRQAAHPMAVAAMREYGLDISTHRAKPLNHDLGCRHDLVLTMDANLRRGILERHPQLCGRVQLLAPEPIADPYGQDRQAFIECRRSIAQAIEAWVPRLRLLSPAAGGARA